MSSPDVTSRELVVQLDRAWTTLRSYRRSMSRYETSAERCAVTGLLRASMLPDGWIGFEDNRELWASMDEFCQAPDDQERRTYAGRHALPRARVDMRRHWERALDGEQLAQVLGEARADKTLADLDFYRRYFEQYLEDPPFDPADTQDRRLPGADQGEVEMAVHLAVAWVNVERTGIVLANVEAAVLGPPGTERGLDS